MLLRKDLKEGKFYQETFIREDHYEIFFFLGEKGKNLFWLNEKETLIKDKPNFCECCLKEI